MALGKLMTESSDLQRELQKTEHDLQAKIAEVGVLETQQEELNKRLMVCSSSVMSHTQACNSSVTYCLHVTYTNM